MAAFKAKGVGSARAVLSLPDGNAWNVEIGTYAGKDLDFTGYAVCGEAEAFVRGSSSG